MSYTKYAGQGVADGVGAGTPTNALEEAGVTPKDLINGLTQKISRVIIEATRVYGSPLNAIINPDTNPYGAGVEIAAFVDGTANKKRDGSCFPRGTQNLAVQSVFSNFAYNNEVRVYDREVNKGMLTADEVARYVAEKMKLPLKTLGSYRHAMLKQLTSGVCDGTRTITSTDSSDGTGAEVVYTATVDGYAGMIGTPDIVIPAPVAGTLTKIPTPDHALTYAMEIEGICADMQSESTEFNKLGINTFTIGKPYLIAETKTLNAMDNVFATQAGYKGFPTVSAREFIRRSADIVEIDAFPAIPANETYTGKRLGGVILDRGAMREFVVYEDVESARCVNERATGYSFQGESIISIYKGVPSYAMLVDAEASG